MMMKCVLVLVAVVLRVSSGMELSKSEYYQLPPLFELDNYEQCLSSPNYGKRQFCLGTFELVPSESRLYQTIAQYSKDKYNFNHSRIHRGYCLSTRCPHVDDTTSLLSRFEACVNSTTSIQYNMNVNLVKLDYCKDTSGTPVDGLDLGFAGVVALLVALNMMGTLYDCFRNKDDKPNQYLMTWSVLVNWKRLIATHEGGDERLSALNPVQGMKALTLILVMLAHSVFSHHLTYVHNPQFLENGNRHFLASLFQNGSIIVQTFLMLSSFLLTYNLLLHVDSTKKVLSLKMLPQVLFHRIARITPLNLVMVGVAATWWRHSSDGPLWTSLVEAEGARCRDKWWAQALYVNNFYKPDDTCLIQTWFLAVDMQLYLVASILTLTLGRRPRLAIKLLAGLFVASIVANFAIAYTWSLKPMVVLMYPELMRIQYSGEPSFKWFYTSPWGSLPCSLLGVLLAFLHHQMQQAEFKPQDYKLLRMVYRASVPCMFAWVFAGYWLKQPESRLLESAYTALDRPVFTLLVALAALGFFYKIDDLWWRLLSWRVWQILGRMSLSVLLVHWCFCLTQVAVRTQPTRASIFETSGDWLVTICMSYAASLPLHLLIELPCQRFLQSLFS